MIIQIIFCSIGFLLSIATILYVLINRKKTVSNIVLKEGEILIASNKKTLRFSLIINIVSNAGLLLFLILAILKKLGENSYLLYLVLLVLFVILSCKYILDCLFSFTLISEDIRVHKLFKKDANYSLDDVKSSIMTNQYIALVGENKRLILPLLYNHPMTKDVINFFNNKGVEFKKELLDYYKIEHKNEIKEDIVSEEVSQEVENENTNVVEDNQANEKYSENQIKSFTLIGKQFREEKKKNLIVDIVSAIIIQLLLLGIILAFVLITKQYLFLIALLINVYLAYKKVVNLKKKYQIDGIDDFKLGLKYAHLNNKVIGYHEIKNKSLKSTIVMAGIVLAIICGFSGMTLFTSKPISYDGMTTIEGNIKTITIDTVVKLTITDNENKYSEYTFIVPNALNDYIDLNNLVSEEEGTSVVIKSTISKDSKDVITYYLKIDSVEYVNEQLIDAYYKDYIKSQTKSFILTCSCSLLFISGLIGYYFYNKAQIKKETIDITK